jgi:hypothetical protein
MIKVSEISFLFVNMTYRNQPNARFVAEFVHLSLILAEEKAVLALHRHKLGPAVLLRAELHHCELVRPHGTSANIPHLAALDEVVKSLHGLFDWRVGIKSMDLEHIDVGCIQTLERLLNGVEDCRSR